MKRIMLVCLTALAVSGTYPLYAQSSGSDFMAGDKSLFHDHTCVQSQNRQGMEELTRYVIDRGHRRIAYVTGEESSVTDVRTVSFLRALMKSNRKTFFWCARLGKIFYDFWAQ